MEKIKDLFNTDNLSGYIIREVYYIENLQCVGGNLPLLFADTKKIVLFLSEELARKALIFVSEINSVQFKIEETIPVIINKAEKRAARLITPEKERALFNQTEFESRVIMDNNDFQELNKASFTWHRYS